MTEFLRIHQVCEILSIAESTFRDRVREGIFPRPVKFGRLSFWRRDEIEQIAQCICRDASTDVLRRLTLRLLEERSNDRP